MPVERTIVVTGVARSGTSMIASLLRTAGVFMGDLVWDVVQEDSEVLSAVQSRDDRLLDRLVNQRNERHAVWGFKVPNLHAYMQAADLSRLRNPRLIVVFRDPVAVAVRTRLSEQVDDPAVLLAATTAMTSMLHFARSSACPCLFVSYEKAITIPEYLIANVLAFCGLETPQDQLLTLAASVRPNNPEYLATANRRFSGCIEGIWNGELYGWCREFGQLWSLDVELFADDRLLGTFPSDVFRSDLEAGGLGNGNHGFFINLRRFSLSPDTLIRVKVSGRTVELEGSGQFLHSYPVVNDPNASPIDRIDAETV